MIVVSDTSPLLYLFSIDALELLPKLYGQILIPEAVHAEIIASGAPAAFREWGKQPPSWLSVRTVQTEATMELQKLDEGERAAIFLAKSLNADLLLVDERKGREVAIAQGINIVGVIGVLDEAAEKELIDIRSAISQLEQTNFRISPRILQALLSRHA